MPGIDALLFVRSLVHDMGHQLVVVEPERHGMGRFAAERAAQPIDVEPLGCFDLVNRKGQMKQDTAHLQRPLTIGLADPSHQPAAILGLRPPASRSQMALATTRRMMPSPWPVMDTAPVRLSA